MSFFFFQIYIPMMMLMTLAVSMASDYKNRLFVDWVRSPSELQSTIDKKQLMLREKKF